ncbi:probable Ras-like G protein RagC [Rhynchosporium agropyri]|uniref:GTP-binding protein n=1 Tax=Rhynchosporium agropyri TaxID=914238 RepID=A0A1E1LQ96_9HELO|nr:probable Ras-like G protein RagC [Rhynchosporium agropyri]
MPLLHTGRRRTKLDRMYNGPARQGPVRHISPAQLNLERLYEQNRANAQKNDPATAPGPAPGPAAKGKPRLLLMGQRRSGKSSISSVVFHKMPPNETLFLESTARIQKDSMHSFMDFQVWDFPGQVDFMDPSFDLDAIFGEMGALIWVIDAQDDYLEAIQHLNNTILNLQPTYLHVNIEVFIHKVDGLSDDYKLDIQRDITQRIQDELSDHGVENAPINFHLTSIYDHSIFEAFSKVIQKLIPHLPTLEALLNNLCRASGFEKAYLFDVLSKIYIATDSSPVDMPSYEICSDYIDVIVDISEIYGWNRPATYIEGLEGPPWNKKIEDQVACKEAESAIVLTDGKRPIMLREVNKYLALVAVMREGSYGKFSGITENVSTTVEGLLKAFEITRQRN